jgi:pimeloyl-ACP methyl ester carboxylesterase
MESVDLDADRSVTVLRDGVGGSGTALVPGAPSLGSPAVRARRRPPRRRRQGHVRAELQPRGRRAGQAEFDQMSAFRSWLSASRSPGNSQSSALRASSATGRNWIRRSSVRSGCRSSRAEAELHPCARSVDRTRSPLHWSGWASSPHRAELVRRSLPRVLAHDGIAEGLPTLPGGSARHRCHARPAVPAQTRCDGAIFDGFVSNVTADHFPLEQLTVPTLIIAARDDSVAPYRFAPIAARRSAERRLVTIEVGGHCFIGHASNIRRAVADFVRQLQ